MRCVFARKQAPHGLAEHVWPLLDFGQAACAQKAGRGGGRWAVGCAARVNGDAGLDVDGLVGRVGALHRSRSRLEYAVATRG